MKKLLLTQALIVVALSGCVYKELHAKNMNTIDGEFRKEFSTSIDP
jgi:hypothetical protein